MAEANNEDMNVDDVVSPSDTPMAKVEIKSEAKLEIKKEISDELSAEEQSAFEIVQVLPVSTLSTPKVEIKTEIKKENSDEFTSEEQSALEIAINLQTPKLPENFFLRKNQELLYKFPCILYKLLKYFTHYENTLHTI